MSQTPTGTTGNAPAQQTAQQDKKPTLTGVRIKQRKGQAKAAAKFEPEGECRGPEATRRSRGGDREGGGERGSGVGVGEEGKSEEGGWESGGGGGFRIVTTSLPTSYLCDQTDPGPL